MIREVLCTPKGNRLPPVHTKGSTCSCLEAREGLEISFELLGGRERWSKTSSRDVTKWREPCRWMWLMRCACILSNVGLIAGFCHRTSTIQLCHFVAFFSANLSVSIYSIYIIIYIYIYICIIYNSSIIFKYIYIWYLHTLNQYIFSAVTFSSDHCEINKTACFPRKSTDNGIGNWPALLLAPVVKVNSIKDFQRFHVLHGKTATHLRFYVGLMVLAPAGRFSVNHCPLGISRLLSEKHCKCRKFSHMFGPFQEREMLEEAKNTAVGSLDSAGMVTLGAHDNTFNVWLAFEETQTYHSPRWSISRPRNMMPVRWRVSISLHKGHVERQ